MPEEIHSTNRLHHQAAILNHIEHTLSPKTGLPHHGAATVTAANFYHLMANDTRSRPNEKDTQTAIRQAMLAVTGYAVTGNRITAQQVAKETELINMASTPGQVAITAMMVPELEEKAMELLDQEPGWRKMLQQAAQGADIDEIIATIHELASRREPPFTSTAGRWATAALNKRRTDQAPGTA